MASSSSPRKAELRPLIEDDPPTTTRMKKVRAPPDHNYDNLRVKAKQLLGSTKHDAMEAFITNLASSRVYKRLYNFCRSEYPNALSLKLSHVLLRSPNSSEIRSKCAYFLHYLLDSPHRHRSVWSSTSPVIRFELKIAFLEILNQENPKEICKQMWKTASQIMGCIITKKQGEWQGMLSFFYESLHSGPPYVQRCALLFFLSLPKCLREELGPYVLNLRLYFLSKFNSSKGKRKASALAALIHLVQHMSSDYYYLFNGLLMIMIKGVLNFLNNDDEEGNAQRSLRKLAELARAEPRFFNSHLDEVFDAMVTISKNDKWDEETRYLAVEMMSYFDDISIKRLGKTILRRLFSELVRVISRIPGDTVNDVRYVNGLYLVTSRDHLLGVTFMYRISMARGDVMPVLLKEIPTYMASEEWQKRYAAVTIIGVIAKGCAQAMRHHLDEVMNVVLKSMLDPSLHVRLAAIGTVKAMSLDLSRQLLDQHGDLLITSLYLALADDRIPIKQTAAALAMSSFCESCSSCIFEPRLDTIVSKLLDLIQDLFCKCYDLVITSLKKFLADATSKSLQEYAVECIWTVAMAVGKDIFKKDATEVVALLLSVRRCLVEDDHSSKVTLLRAWEQLHRCLGSHSYPYVKDLMPDLLRSARLGLNKFIGCAELVILTEKLMACKVLFHFTSKFKGKFFPWIDQVSDVLIPLVTFHDEAIRKLAVSAMPKLLLSTKLSIETKQAHGLTNSYLHKLVLQVVPSLVEALNTETQGEICAMILKSLSKCIKIGGAFLSQKKIQQMANAIVEVLEETAMNLFSEEENVTQIEKEIIKQVVNYFRTLIKIYEENSWPLVDKFLGCIKAMLDNDCMTAKEKQIGLLAFHEVSLTCKEAAVRF